MQTLWSRAALAQSSCRCRICSHSTNALIRRSTSASSRRRLTVADVFTACYTTILGTATIIDARRKNRRRQALDRELDRTRASLKQLAAASPPSSLDGQNSTSDGEKFSPPGWLSTRVDGRSTHEAVRPLLEELGSLYNMTYRPPAHVPWIQDQINWADIEASIVIEEQDPNAWRRGPRTHREMTDLTVTVVDLVDELLRRAQTHASHRPQDISPIIDDTKEAVLTELEYLRQENGYPGYMFPSNDPEYSARIRARLNGSIRRIFNQAVSSRETVGRIGYNLLTAGVPPTIHTYNTLIAGFNRIQRPDLAEAVIDSYLHRTKWPATIQTVICLLNHYRRPGGREGLREIVQRMRGAVDDGLHLSSNSGRTRKKARGDAAFDHLIRGWLYHEDVGIACMTFVACLRQGASIPISTSQELFRSFLATVNFQSARKLLIGIARNFDNFKWYLSYIVEDNAIAAVRELLHSLGRVIDIAWLPLGEIYGQNYEKYAAATISLKSTISFLDAQLEAISNTDTAPLSTRSPTTYQRAYTRVARIISIERRCTDLEEKTQYLAAALRAGIIYVKTGYDIDPRSVLLSDKFTSPAFLEQRLALRIALSHINVYDDITREDITSQLFQRIPNPDLIRQLEETGYCQKLDRRVLVSLFAPGAVSPIASEEEIISDLYQQLEQQVQAAEDSIRALLFTLLSFRKQRQALHYYRGYYRIPLRSLAGYIRGSADNHWHKDIISTSSQYNEHTTHGVLESLLQLESQQVTSLDHSVSVEPDYLGTELIQGPTETWRSAGQGEEGPPLQHGSLG
ncbi:hypothetical protein GGR51DRAFT_535536 [Nemania sp. FL0031]|nr:hypothetical protein GGR51DRAFT_535536 [Nemania sp. FL0031]